MKYERYIKKERIKIMTILGIGILLSFLIAFFIFYFLEGLSSFLAVLNMEELTLRPWSYVLPIISFLLFFLYWMMAFRIGERLEKIKKLKGLG